MSTSVRINNGCRDMLLQSIATKFNNGKFAVYSGAQPSNGNDAATGTKLVEFTLTEGYGAVVPGAGYVDLEQEFVVNAIATGTAGYGRMSSVDGLVTVDGSVGVSGTDFIIDNVNTISGNPVRLLSARFIQPTSGS